MAVTMTKGHGVTVLTLTSDPQSSWPPLCQIFKALCYSPVCCTVSQHLRGRTSLSVLGTLQIIVGLLNIGLGIILRISDTVWYPVNETLFPVWVGVLFMIFGSMCILSEKYPSPCLVIVNVILNLAGVAFAITAIVLYSITLGNIYFWRKCERYYWSGDTSTTPSVSPDERALKETCLWYRSVVLMLVRSITAVLIVLSALQLCVAISASILGIKALKKKKNGENEGTDDPEHYKPLLEDVTAD